jgi:hypothetical protein
MLAGPKGCHDRSYPFLPAQFDGAVAQLVERFLRLVVSVGRILRHQPAHRERDAFGHVRGHLAHVWHGRAVMLAHDLLCSRPLAGPVGAEHLIHRHAERIEVRTDVAAPLIAGAFGGDVERRADHCARAGENQAVQLPRKEGRPEVVQLGRSVVVQQHSLRGHVSVREAKRINVGQPSQHVLRKGQHAVDAQGGLRVQEGAKIGPQKLRHDVAAVAAAAQVQQADNADAAQLAGGCGPFEQAPDVGHVALDEGFRKDLHAHLAA